jgi:hypothetical protein
MPKVISKLVSGAKAEPETLRKIQDLMGIQPGIAIELMVFQITYGSRTSYCCWSGGELRKGQPYLTLVGQAAMEALVNLPRGNEGELIFQELIPGSIPLREKVEMVLEKASDGAKICFVGDMQGELGHQLHEAFGVVPERISVGN